VIKTENGSSQFRDFTFTSSDDKTPPAQKDR
jgi:hypothetical protein